MKNELGYDPNVPAGTRDAIHVPIVIGRLKENSFFIERLKDHENLKPGKWVKFVDNKYIEFELSDKENGHGIIDPFLDEVSVFDDIRILLRPGITSPVRHEYEINPEMLKFENELLQQEVEARKEEDPNCASCWQIKNRKVIRY